MPKGPQSAPEPDLRVVVLAYGAGEEYVALLDSLAAEGIPAERILLVHNPSLPGQRPPLPPAGIEVLETGRNVGYAGGMNAGIECQLARGCETLLLVTHDARFRPGALRELLAAAVANPGFGALGPALVLAGTETPFSFGGVTRRSGSTHHRHTAPQAIDGIAPADWIDGGTMLIRVEALRRAGGFDVGFWSYCEEADLCLRIARSGFGVGVVLAAVAEQAPGGAKRPGAWSYLLTRNGIAYAARFAGWRGLAGATAGALFLGLAGLARAAARATRLRPGSPAEPLAIGVGALRGLLDFARGRWGPPPTDLPGLGDLANASAGRPLGGAGAD